MGGGHLKSLLATKRFAVGRRLKVRLEAFRTGLPGFIAADLIYAL
jgi:hypothetical protein